MLYVILDPNYTNHVLDAWPELIKKNINFTVILSDHKYFVETHKNDSGALFYFVGKTVQEYKDNVSKVSTTRFYKKDNWEEVILTYLYLYGKS